MTFCEVSGSWGLCGPYGSLLHLQNIPIFSSYILYFKIFHFHRVNYTKTLEKPWGLQITLIRSLLPLAAPLFGSWSLKSERPSILVLYKCQYSTLSTILLVLGMFYFSEISIFSSTCSTPRGMSFEYVAREGVLLILPRDCCP